jgi:FtsH-binding integral membrane protein
MQALLIIIIILVTFSLCGSATAQDCLSGLIQGIIIFGIFIALIAFAFGINPILGFIAIIIAVKVFQNMGDNNF